MAKYELCDLSELPEGTCKSFKVEGRGVALFNVDGTLYATQDFCRHKGGSLGKGELQGSIVVCPLHGWRFDVITGDCLTQPHCKKLRLFPTYIDGERILVDI